MNLGKCRVPVFVIALGCAAVVSAHPTKLVERNGHLSPINVKITFMNDSNREVLLLGIGGDDKYGTHQWGVRTEAGTTQREIWLDNLKMINGTNSLRRLTDQFTVTLKDGRELPVSFSYYNCDKEMPTDRRDDWVCRFLYVKSEDDSSQKIDLRNVKSVEFLGPLRKDKAGNAMFEHWVFSPFTGEKLTAPAK